MNKEARYGIYKGSVLPGWWSILDAYIPRILAIDPSAEIEVKEKFGTLRIWVGSLIDDHTPFANITQEAELESSGVCECCGAPGHRRNNRRYIETLCDRCANANNSRKSQIIEDTEKRWLTEANTQED